MHEIEDTEATDAASELVWPQYYKHTLRFNLQLYLREFLAKDHLLNVIEPIQGDVVEENRIDGYAKKIVIGAENGADEVFESIHASFSKGISLPCIFLRQKSLLRDQLVPLSIQAEIDQVICHEYGQEHLYTHIYEDHYQNAFPSFDEFVANISKKAVTGIINGAEDMYKRIVRSLLYRIPIPQARRHPRAMKGIS